MEPALVAIVVVVVLVVLAAGLLSGRRDRPRGRPDEAPDRAEGTSGVLEAPPEEKAPPEEAPPEEAPPEEAPPGGEVAVEDERTAPGVPVEAPEPAVEEAPPSLAERFRQRLSQTRNRIGVGVAELFGGGVSEEAWERLEEALIGADVGVEATMEIVEELRDRARTEGVTDGATVLELLKEELRDQLGTADRSLARTHDDRPTVWLLTGVNGTGKTTTIGKLAAIEDGEGRKAVLAAADTFRAAAAEQLGLWAERTNARLVRKEEGADPASVAYDGFMAAKATDAELLMIDTAGRLHNRRELMEELAKVKRVVEKQAGTVEETLLVLDATTGQNGIQQARAFTEAVDVTGLVLTKLDGSSRGGIVVAVQRQLGLPVKLVGIGESAEDLAPFDPDAFVEGLFADGDGD